MLRTKSRTPVVCCFCGKDTDHYVMMPNHRMATFKYAVCMGCHENKENVMCHICAISPFSNVELNLGEFRCYGCRRWVCSRHVNGYNWKCSRC